MNPDTFFKLVILIDLSVVFYALVTGNYSGELFKEDAFVTKFSYYQLLFLSFLSFYIFNIRKSQLQISNWRSLPVVWLIIALGFLYLSFDEVNQYHEYLDINIHNLFHIKETGFTDRIDDLIVGIYLFLGIYLLSLYKEEVLLYKKAKNIFLVAFYLTVLMIIFDSLSNRNDILYFFVHDIDYSNYLQEKINIFEDILKIFAEGVLLGGICSCLNIAKKLKLV